MYRSTVGAPLRGGGNHRVILKICYLQYESWAYAVTMLDCDYCP